MTKEIRIEAAKHAIKELTSNAINKHGFVPGYVKIWCEAINEYIEMDETPINIIFGAPTISTKEIEEAFANMAHYVSILPNEPKVEHYKENPLFDALTKLGISLKTADGEWRDTADILNEIAVKWRGVF